MYRARDFEHAAKIIDLDVQEVAAAGVGTWLGWKWSERAWTPLIVLHLAFAIGMPFNPDMSKWLTTRSSRPRYDFVPLLCGCEQRFEPYVRYL